MNETFHRLMALAQNTATEWYKDSAGEAIVPSFFGLTADNKMIILAAPWQSDREREILTEKIKAIFKENGIVAYAFIHEMWVSPTSAKTGIAPVDSADRQEVVALIVADAKVNAVKMLKIARDKDDNITSIDEVLHEDKEPVPHGDPKMSRMSSLLVPQEEVQKVSFPGLMSMPVQSLAIH